MPIPTEDILIKPIEIPVCPPKLPAITAKELARVAEPMRDGDLKRKTPAAIINDLKICVEAFVKLL